MNSHFINKPSGAPILHCSNSMKRRQASQIMAGKKLNTIDMTTYVVKNNRRKRLSLLFQGLDFPQVAYCQLRFFFFFSFFFFLSHKESKCRQFVFPSASGFLQMSINMIMLSFSERFSMLLQRLK